MGIKDPFDFTTPPWEAIDYFKGKGKKVSFHYDEMLHEAHNKAFTVAKITRLDLLSDIHLSLKSAMESGQDFKAWQKNIQPTLKEKGWWGAVEAINPITGEVKDIRVDSRRLRTIYETNMRTSYAKGRYAAQMESDAEFLRYNAILDQHTRPSHSARNGIILPKNSPWWEANYPPNGWKCRCKATAMTSFEVKRRGLTPYEGIPPTLADKDWAYHVGKGDTTLQTYKDKVDALESKGLPKAFIEVAQKELNANQKTLNERTDTFKAIKELFSTTEKKSVELCKSTLFGEAKRVLLSSDTIQSHTHHPEIGAFEYSLIPQMLGGVTFIQKESVFVIVKRLGKYYRLALKNVKNTDEMYAVSLVRANKKDDFQRWMRELDKFKRIDKR